MRTFEKLSFGGGYYWFIEAVFQSLKGVEKVEQDWMYKKTIKS